MKVEGMMFVPSFNQLVRDRTHIASPCDSRFLCRSNCGMKMVTHMTPNSQQWAHPMRSVGLSVWAYTSAWIRMFWGENCLSVNHAVLHIYACMCLPFCIYSLMSSLHLVLGLPHGHLLGILSLSLKLRIHLYSMCDTCPYHTILMWILRLPW